MFANALGVFCGHRRFFAHVQGMYVGHLWVWPMCEEVIVVVYVCLPIRRDRFVVTYGFCPSVGHASLSNIVIANCVGQYSCA